MSIEATEAREMVMRRIQLEVLVPSSSLESSADWKSLLWPTSSTT